jgi:hypothetical protein
MLFASRGGIGAQMRRCHSERHAQRSPDRKSRHPSADVLRFTIAQKSRAASMGSRYARSSRSPPDVKRWQSAPVPHWTPAGVVAPLILAPARFIRELDETHESRIPRFEL